MSLEYGLKNHKACCGGGKLSIVMGVNKFVSNKTLGSNSTVSTINFNLSVRHDELFCGE